MAPKGADGTGNLSPEEGESGPLTSVREAQQAGKNYVRHRVHTLGTYVKGISAVRAYLTPVAHRTTLHQYEHLSHSVVK